MRSYIRVSSRDCSGKWQLIITLIGRIGLHIRVDFRYGMRQRGCTQPSSMVKSINNQLRYTFKFTTVYFLLQLLPSVFDAHSL